MKLSNLNDYLQTFATMGAIVGLLLVGYEVRQSNAIANSQYSSSAYSAWANAALSEIESGIAQIRVKAVASPDELTLQEKMDLDSYLWHWMYLSLHDVYGEAALNGRDSPVVAFLLEELQIEAPIYFGSRFSRAWLQINKTLIDPDVFSSIERGLELAPIGSDIEYYESIDRLAATLE